MITYLLKKKNYIKTII